MPSFAASSRWTRLILAWLIVWLGCAGMLPALAAPSAGAQMDEICSVIMGVDASASQPDAGGTLVHQHQTCSFCAAAMAAPPPSVVPVTPMSMADTAVVFPAALPRSEPVAASWQARAPPVVQS
jgi:hypothetical protein